ncbi:MAG: PTS system mannose/fructose/sorbose family transporter subunit IID [Chloroflexi bacterium]|nr:PTS system mannose/fructose/sorbose family transporter subunit IID [Chloroflexota bacterium]
MAEQTKTQVAQTGGAGQKKITKAELNRAWWIWIFFNLSAFSMERMQAPAFVYMMSPILKKLYGDNPDEMKQALKRHMVFFNTEPQTGVIAHGVAIAMEEQRANGAPIDDAMINAVKAGIMGPMAGIGDSMIPGTLIPILLAIGIGMSSGTGSALGPIFYIISYTVIILLVSYYLFNFGYRYGTDAFSQLAAGGFRRITSALAVLGLVVAGGVGAVNTTLNTPLAYKSGTNISVSVQSQLNAIYPTLLPLLLTLWLFYGMRRRGWPINRVLLMVLLVIFIGYLPGLVGSIFNIPWLTALRIF